MADSDRSPVVDGLFYGAAAYVFSYLFVYLQVLRGPTPTRKMLEAAGADPAAAGESLDKTANLLVPTAWQYAGWMYHFAKGGSVGVSINLLPGSYPINGSLLFPGVHDKVSETREIVLTDPTRLPEAVDIVTNLDAMTLVTATPSALFIAGAVLAYRNNEVSPVGGAISGAKVTAGFLLLSAIGVFLFTASVSGITLDASGSVSAGGEVGLEVIDFTGEVESGLSASVEPTLEIGPTFGRAVLSGFVYPMLFGSMGGVAGAKAGLLKAPGRWIKKRI